MSTAEKLIEQGKKMVKLEGIQAGIEKGKLEGRYEDIKKLLSKGFEPKQVADLLEIEL